MDTVRPHHTDNDLCHHTPRPQYPPRDSDMDDSEGNHDDQTHTCHTHDQRSYSYTGIVLLSDHSPHRQNQYCYTHTPKITKHGSCILEFVELFDLS